MQAEGACRAAPSVGRWPQTLQALGSESWPLTQGGVVHQEEGLAEWLHLAGAAAYKATTDGW